VFREVRRVLRKDGTCWVNLGDSYMAGQGGRQSAAGLMPLETKRTSGRAQERTDVDVLGWGERDVTEKVLTSRESGLKPKDLVGIPWRVAFALQADGWYLRSDIIWSKPNPMPESVTDRPTKAHEYLFLLTKSPRYYYDADAVREPAPFNTNRHMASNKYDRTKGISNGDKPEGTFGVGDPPLNRNLRTVWTIATQPYPGAHFATFPEALVEPCVKAGTSERGVCPECGAPWTREVERRTTAPTYRNGNRPETTHAVHGESDTRTLAMVQEVTTTGWRPSCVHRLNSAVTWDDPAFAGVNRDERSPVPATVLDPFAGSGTTGRVAQRLGRKAVLIDLSGEYLTQTMKRNADIPLGLETA
jgi:DNA modification methylase